jgi:putative endonuclease
MRDVKAYFVYMVRCSDRSFYVGITNNPDYRLAQHNLGIDSKSYTFSRRPVELVHSSEFRQVDDAIRWEKQLKGWSRAKKQALARDDWAAIHELSRRRSRPSTAPLRGSAQDDKLRQSLS